MASYEEFEAWHRATNFTGDLLFETTDDVPVAEFGVKLIVGDDPLPSPANPQIQEGMPQ